MTDLDALPYQMTVIIPTRNRADVLSTALESHVAQQTNINWNIVVVDNASTDRTQETLRNYRDRLRLTILYEPTLGKSRALNRALMAARGEVIAFTDDDVQVSPGWLSELWEATTRHREAGVFCGPIRPVFPLHTPDWLRNHPFAAAAFAKFDYGSQECALPPPLLPFGPNFAVRAGTINGMEFREDLGPSKGRTGGWEDIEFLHRLRSRAERFIYLPHAGVSHLIRDELIDSTYLFDRAFNNGQGNIRVLGKLMIVPKQKRFLDPECADFSRGALINFYLGQLSVLAPEKTSLQRLRLTAELELLSWQDCRHLLCPKALRWVSNDPLSPESALS